MISLCPREDCPVERMRRVLHEERVKMWARQKLGPDDAKGAFEHVLNCATCGQLKGWRGMSDGSEREIPSRVLWGNAQSVNE
ncbi:MAG: hypothetical protein AB7P35_17775 [Hyphomonadaceae bacterium]